jgi:hypothetical protein
MGVECRASNASTPVAERYSNPTLTRALTTMGDRRPCAHSQSAHANQNAAGARVKTPTTEIMLIATSGADMIANGSFHCFHEIQHTADAATSQTVAITLEVAQSQTMGDSLLAEQPHGLDAITKTDSSTAARAHAPNTKATTLVIRKYGSA